MKSFLLIALSVQFILINGYGQRLPCSSTDIAVATTFDTTQTRGLADNYYLWDPGQKISVKFLTGSPALQHKIELIAREWERYANIHFSFVQAGNSNARINLDDKGGHNSLIGTLANSVSQNQKTMNFDTTDFTDQSIHRIVLHEFGHLLGLLHEHFSPLAGISWNKQAVYNDLYKTNGWDTATVNANIFQTYALSYTNGTLYDKQSIMHYPILATWTTNQYSVDWNDSPSTGDKRLIAALYPFVGNRPRRVPRIQISPIQRVEILNSPSKNGLAIYPRFSLATADREGIVIFVVFFYNADGTPIVMESDKYSVNNQVATFKTATLPPKLHLQSNSNVHNFELFIPYSAFPRESTHVQAKFTAYLWDNHQLKLLSSSSLIPCNLLK
jgi:hypothetical protein